MKTIGLPPLARGDDKAVAERRNALREVEILRGLESPHVLHLEETILEPASAQHACSELHILTEYCDAGDLAGLLRRGGRTRGLAERDVWAFAAAILAGLEVLHSRRILHRDLKPANIFLKREPPPASPQPNSGGQQTAAGGGRSPSPRPVGCRPASPSVRVLVGDLGIARTVTSTQPMAETIVGTPLYCAPEIFEGQPYDEKADIYSYGVCVYELMHGRPPWADAQNVAGLVRHVLRLGEDTEESVLKVDAHFSEDLRRLVTDCLGRHPAERPTAAELLARVPEEHRSSAGVCCSVDAADAIGEAASPAMPVHTKGAGVRAAPSPRTSAGLRAPTPPGKPGPFAFRPSSRAAGGAGAGGGPELEAPPSEAQALDPSPGQSQTPRLAAVLEAALHVAPSAQVLGQPGRRQEGGACGGGGGGGGPCPEGTLRCAPALAGALAAEPCEEAADSTPKVCQVLPPDTAPDDHGSTITLEAIHGTLESTARAEGDGGGRDAPLASVAPPAAGAGPLATRSPEDSLQAAAPHAFSGRPSTRGSPKRPPGPLAYVARAHECWARWRREKQEAKLKVTGVTVSGGGAGRAQPAPEFGLGLEIRGVAPARTPKLRRPAGRL